MARNSIFDILEEKYDLGMEISRLDFLLSRKECVYDTLYEIDEYTIEKFVNGFCFYNWKNRCRCLTCTDMRNVLGINPKKWENVTIHQALIFIEYCANMIFLCSSYVNKDKKFDFYADFDVLVKNLQSLAEHLNYDIEYFEDKQMALVVEKNPAATAAAEIVEDDETAFKIIEYNHYLLKGDLDRKKEILKALGDEFEPIRPNLKSNGYSDMESDAGFLLNNMNIRHNNLDGPKKKEFTASLTPAQLEEWYDKTYNILLLCILANDYIPLHEDMKTLKNHY